MRAEIAKALVEKASQLASEETAAKDFIGLCKIIRERAVLGYAAIELKYMLSDALKKKLEDAGYTVEWPVPGGPPPGPSIYDYLNRTTISWWK